MGKKYSERVKSNGYYAVYMPEHPSAFGRGYVYEHRHIVEEHIGRHLSPTEIVHHKNGDKLNNNIYNLELISSISEHKAKHRTENSKIKQLPNEPNTIIKCACGCNRDFFKYDRFGRERQYFNGGCFHRHRRIIKQYCRTREKVLCACGCGAEILKYDKSGRVRQFISGHNSGGTPNRTILAQDTGLSFATIINYFSNKKLRDKTVKLIEKSIIDKYGKDYLRK